MNEWQCNTGYKKGDIVEFENKRYTALRKIHSTVEPNISDNWNLLPPEKYVAHEVISGMPVEDTSMPVMQLDEPFRISRPEAVKQIMEILDVTVGDKVRILESLVLMYTKDE